MSAPAGRASREAFAAVWRGLGARTDPAPIYGALAGAYREPHRRYHTLDHIAHVLGALDDVRLCLADPDAGEMALWLHDVVYDVHAEGSEARSALWAREALKESGVELHLVGRVADLIMATAPAATPIGGDAGYVADADLSILGAPGGQFDRYEQQIREEYAGIPEPVFRARRAAILHGLLERPTIFRTPEFQRLEGRARANLARSLAHLEPR